MRRSSRHRTIALTATGLLAIATMAGVGWTQGWRTPPRYMPLRPVDRNFAMCRLMYTEVRREEGGQGWETDYPLAELNFMTRLAELTKTAISRDSTGEPIFYTVSAMEDALFQCPFLIASDVGTAEFSPHEVLRLRAYLLKGGFLWADDFWGSYAWENWIGELNRILPPTEYFIEDIAPDSPLLTTPYIVPKIPQITSIQFWRRMGGTTTSERREDSAVPHLRIVRDKAGRIMVVMTHNTDIADAWEREGEDDEFFYTFAHDGYAVGINVLIYAMSH